MITLAMESASIASDWIEFSQLATQRNLAFKSMPSPISGELLARVNEVDARIMQSIAERKKAIAEKMGKTARFRRTLEANAKFHSC